MACEFRMQALVFALVAFVGLSSIDSANAYADGCDDCKQRCRDEVEQCKNAAPDRLCRGPAAPVCKFMKDFNCPNVGTFCRKFTCGVGGPCDGGGGGGGGGGGKISGEPHILSLDRMRFDFQQVGEYAVARSETADIEMQARLAAYGQTVSVMKMVAIRTDGHRIVFEAGKGMVVDQQSMPLDEAAVYISERVSVRDVSTGKYLMQIGDTNLWVTIHSGYLDINLDPDKSTIGSWQGLLGDFDGKPDNDFKTRDGKVFDKNDVSREVLYGEFGDSWRLDQAESFLLYGEGETTQTFSDESFPSAHRSIADFDKTTFDKARAACVAKGVLRGEALRNCIYDVGVTGAEEFADGYVDALAGDAKGALTHAGSFGMHVQESSHQGAFVPVFWSGAVDQPVLVSLYSEKGKKISATLGKGENPILLRLPSVVGKYSLRLNQGEQDADRAIWVTEARATLGVPDTVAGATDFIVTWTGPLGKGDYVSLNKAGETRAHRHLAYFWAHRTKDAVFQAPATPGDYEIWYVLQGSGGGSPIAKKTIKVTEASASVTPPVAEVVVGAHFPVLWTGPKGQGDYIDLVPMGYTKASGQLHYNWVSKSKEGAVSLRAPAAPGTYDIRYIASTSAGRAVLTTATIKVSDAKADLTLPTSALAGEKFEISWTGPMHRNDFIAVGPVGAKDGSGHLHFIWAKAAGKGMLRAPREPGTYEVTYVLTGSDKRRVLVRKKIDVKEK